MIKFKMMKHSVGKQWSLLFSANMSSMSSKSTHYDTLEIESKATQNDIKSAYFKLTKKYHPDLNSSEAAKVKFREVTNAYEVLGSYNKRRQYDRGLQIHNPSYDKPEYKAPTMARDLAKEAERVRNEYNRIQHQEGKPNYNFDAWTDAHYGKILRRTRNDRLKQEFLNEVSKEYRQHSSRAALDISVLFVFASACMLFVIWQSKNQFDDPRLPPSIDQNKENRTTDEASR